MTKVFTIIAALPGHALELMIQAYRYGVSPLLPPRCRFAPTCSEFALDAVRHHGAAKGLWLALGRISRCHPWGGNGFDPVPPADHRHHAKCPGHRASGLEI